MGDHIYVYKVSGACPEKKFHETTMVNACGALVKQYVEKSFPYRFDLYEKMKSSDVRRILYLRL